MRFKFNKQLKIEGIAILILFLFFVIGAIFAFVFPDSLGNYRIFAIMLTSPLLLMALIAVLIYWLYQVFKHQKQH